MIFDYGLELNVSNRRESDAEEIKPARIITDRRSLLNQTVMRIQNKKYGRTLASIEEYGKI